MKRLRANDQEKASFINRIIQKFKEEKSNIEDFSIDDIKKEFSEIPEEVVKPTIYVTADAYMQMLELINQSPVECSWHGLVTRDEENNTYTVYDILVFPQINSATSTTTDEKEFAEWQTQLIMDPTFPIEDLRLHGHSHVNMNVFSSGVDDRYQKDLITKVEDGDYYIFFIMNKKMEICIFLYDFKQQIMFEKKDLNFDILTSEGYCIRKWAEEELEENATTGYATTKKDSKVPTYQESFDDFYYGESYFSKSSPIFKSWKLKE